MWGGNKISTAKIATLQEAIYNMCGWSLIQVAGKVTIQSAGYVPGSFQLNFHTTILLPFLGPRGYPWSTHMVESGDQFYSGSAGTWDMSSMTYIHICSSRL